MLLHNILDRIVDHYQPILDYLEEALDELEERALARPEPSVLGQIAVRKRELLNLRRIVGPQREVVAQLTRGEVPFIRESTRVYLRDVQDHLIRTVEMVELYRDLVLGSRDIYLSSISNRLNETMRTLTILSVIALPMTVVTGFFGMNFESIPGLHSREAFWITVAVMIVAVAGLLYLFRRKGWLGPVSGRQQRRRRSRAVRCAAWGRGHRRGGRGRRKRGLKAVSGKDLCKNIGRHGYRFDHLPPIASARRTIHVGLPVSFALTCVPARRTSFSTRSIRSLTSISSR